MATLTVRNLDPKALDALRALSAARGRSMEAQPRLILADAVLPGSNTAELGLGSRIRARFHDLDVPEVALSDDMPRAAQFSE